MEKDHNDKNIGKKLDGRYEITELIGEGGMADVYRATDVVENRTVAVKILKKEFAENEEFLRRFRNESKAIAVLSHPNIVRIFDVGFSDRIQWIAMEYIDGITLNEYMEQQGALDWRDAVHFILQILRALQQAHSKGIVHRDIKPQNIMMLQDGTIKVMDFGIAKFAREDGKTGTDKAIGTVHYISPEQARGAATDAKSDLYSVGVMLYEMLTGKKPFDTDNPVSIAVMHMQEKVPLPSSINPDIQIGLEEIILKAMEKDPADRYQSARDMMDDLQTFKENPDGVFGYYPELLGGDVFAQPETPVDLNKTQSFDAGAADDIVREEGGYYDEEAPADESYYEDEVYDEEPYGEDDEEYEEEERPSLFVPILSAVIIVVILIAAVFFTTLIVNWFRQGQSNTEEEMRMPNLVGMDFEEARVVWGDQIQIVVESREYSDLDRDKIFAQDIQQNDPVVKGDVVNVKVSLGSKKVTLPNISGWDYVQAEQALRNVNLYVDKRSTYDDEIEEGMVIKTEPEGPAEVEPGSYIRVYVSLGKNSTNVPVPNFINMKWDLAKSTAEDLGLVLQKEDVDDKTEIDTILAQNVAVGEEVSEGSVITVKVSTGRAKEQPVSISFQIPVNAAGMFHITLYDGGIPTAVGGSFNPEYAAGVTRVTAEGTGQTELTAILTNEETGASATIGRYTVDYDSQAVSPIESDSNAAFAAVGGITQTAPPATTAAPVVTTTEAPVVTTVVTSTEQPVWTQAPDNNQGGENNNNNG